MQQGYLKELLSEALALIIFIHIEIQDTDWLYFTKRASLNSDEQLFPACFYAAKDSQPA